MLVYTEFGGVLRGVQRYGEGQSALPPILLAYVNGNHYLNLIPADGVPHDALRHPRHPGVLQGSSGTWDFDTLPTGEQQQQQVERGLERQRGELEQQRLLDQQRQERERQQQEQQCLLDQQRRESEREQEQQQQQQQGQQAQQPQQQQQPPPQQPRPQMLDQQDNHLSFEERLRARHIHHAVPSLLRPGHNMSSDTMLRNFVDLLGATDDPAAAPGVNEAYRNEVLWYTQHASRWIDPTLSMYATPPNSTPPLRPVQPGLPAWRELTPVERQARQNLVAAFRRFNTVLSPAEVSDIIDGDGIIFAGYAVHINENGFIYPLSNSRETGLARSQVPEELFRHSLGRFARLDISRRAGHWERWRKYGVSREEQAEMDEIAQLVVASGFHVTIAMGEQASQTLLRKWTTTCPLSGFESSGPCYLCLILQSVNCKRRGCVRLGPLIGHSSLPILTTQATRSGAWWAAARRRRMPPSWITL